MKRRSFLQASFVGAAALTLPSWLGCAFGTGTKGDLSEDDFSKGTPLARAFLYAQSKGKPLLVFVVPPLPFDDDTLNTITEEQRNQQYAVYDVRRQRGYAFGELLNYGSEEQLWPLSLCEVICALPEDIAALTGNFSGAPLMALLETNTETPRAIPLDGKLPEMPEGLYYNSNDKNPPDPDQLAAERTALLARLYTKALAPNDKELKARAEQCQKTLAEEAKTLENPLADGTLSIPQADQIAGLVAYKSVQEPQQKAKLRSLLASAVKERLCKKQIEGSRWANSSGCGVTYEDPEPKKTKLTIDEEGREVVVYVAVGCGMGHVPEKSQRFLSFYTEESKT